MSKDTAFAAFSNQEQMAKAVASLKSAGFADSEIRFVAPRIAGDKDFAFTDQVTLAGQGAEIGGAVGLVLGATLGIAASLGAIRLPFLSPYLISSPVWATVLGGLFGGALGASAGALIGAGIPGAPGDRYARYLDDGGSLLSVHAESRDRLNAAFAVLENSGGLDLTSGNERRAWARVFLRSRKVPLARWGKIPH